jgi:hypothetical protein
MKPVRLAGWKVHLVLDVGVEDQLVATNAGSASALADPHPGGLFAWDRQEAHSDLGAQRTPAMQLRPPALAGRLTTLVVATHPHAMCFA